MGSRATDVTDAAARNGEPRETMVERSCAAGGNFRSSERVRSLSLPNWCPKALAPEPLIMMARSLLLAPSRSGASRGLRDGSFIVIRRGAPSYGDHQAHNQRQDDQDRDKAPDSGCPAAVVVLERRQAAGTSGQDAEPRVPQFHEGSVLMPAIRR